MYVSARWIEKWYPGFAQKVRDEIDEANRRVDEILGRDGAEALITQEATLSAKTSKKPRPPRGPGMYRLPGYTKQSLEMPRPGTQTELVYIWLVLTNGDPQAVTRILKFHPRFDSETASAAVASVYKRYKFG